MARQLVQLKDLPSSDGRGVIELTWRDWRTVQVYVETTSGSHKHPDVESFTQTEIVHYYTSEDRLRLLEIYKP